MRPRAFSCHVGCGNAPCMNHIEPATQLLTLRTPIEASTPISPPTAEMTCPFLRIVCPTCTSDPISRMASPLRTLAKISTISSREPSSDDLISFVSSTITTAVAPSGRAPPVVILAICPGTNLVAAPSDAAAMATAVTGYCPGPSVSSQGHHTLFLCQQHCLPFCLNLTTKCHSCILHTHDRISI